MRNKVWKSRLDRPVRVVSSIAETRKAPSQTAGCLMLSAVIELPVAGQLAVGLNDVQFVEHLLQSLDRLIHLLMGVGSHQRVSHKSVGGRTSGRYNGVDEYSLVECTGYHDECLAQITHVRCIYLPYLSGICGSGRTQCDGYGLSLASHLLS